MQAAVRRRNVYYINRIHVQVDEEIMVPIIDLTEENLDRRIQRIRERDEEIEKKHREAEADRLNALKMNAMVKIKPTTDDDWPRAHKYDTHDFGNEVKDNETPTIQPHSAKLNRKPKYSFEFQGPPADPFYYFLTDVERGDNPPPPQPSREERTSVNSARKHINRKPNGIANNTAKNRVANNLPLKRSGFPRMHRQKTDEIGLKRESETERINAMFPLASRVIGPLKLAGGDYYTKKFHRSRSSGDLDVEKRRSKSAHVSRHSDTKVVRCMYRQIILSCDSLQISFAQHFFFHTFS